MPDTVTPVVQAFPELSLKANGWPDRDELDTLKIYVLPRNISMAGLLTPSKTNTLPLPGFTTVTTYVFSSELASEVISEDIAASAFMSETASEVPRAFTLVIEPATVLISVIAPATAGTLPTVE